jgi:hypothetical protein
MMVEVDTSMLCCIFENPLDPTHPSETWSCARKANPLQGPPLPLPPPPHLHDFPTIDRSHPSLSTNTTLDLFSCYCPSGIQKVLFLCLALTLPDCHFREPSAFALSTW